MTIKQRIRNWLGINDAPEPITEDQLRKMIGEAIDALVNNETDDQKRWPSYGYNEAIFSNFMLVIRRVIEKETHNEAVKHVERKVNNEEFLDKIIDRIKRKQLNQQ